MNQINKKYIKSTENKYRKNIRRKQSGCIDSGKMYIEI